MIAADGPTSVSAEMTLPQSPENLRKWQADSYTPHKYIEAWQTALQFYAADFPNQFVFLSVGSGLNINDQGKSKLEKVRARGKQLSTGRSISWDPDLYCRTAISMQARISIRQRLL